ncbi:MAG: hypothetical protein PF795_15560 [Kiritimatiellae bacterium]|jgi:hypothetical protein|nr:hypothetical protein [Kiritimatiellia bacterium]
MKDLERNLGPQPIAGNLESHGLGAHDLVLVSSQHLTHKMVSRACKGRRLTSNVKLKIRDALNARCEQVYTVRDLFTY